MRQFALYQVTWRCDFRRLEMIVSQPRTKPESTRQWVTGLVVIAATIISFVGFARVSLNWTLAISSIVLVALVLFLWHAGGGKERSRRRRG